MTVIHPQATGLDGFTVLDVRVSPKLGKELSTDIIESVEWSQKWIQTTLPDKLVVTQKQFVSLQPYTDEMFHTTDRMFVTPLNVMEVVIDRDVDIVEGVEQALKDVDESNIADHVDYPTDEP